MGIFEYLRKQVVEIVNQVIGRDAPYIQVPASVKIHSGSEVIPKPKPKPREHFQELGKNLIVSLPEDYDLCESSGYLRAIYFALEVENDLGQVVILGSAEGGWPKVTVEEFSSEWIHSYLWWKNHERPGLIFHDERVSVKTEDIGSVRPYGCRTLLCNMQPGSLELELTNLEVLTRWLEYPPKIFVIRVINYSDRKVISQLQILQKRLNCGCLIGVVDHERGPVEAVYFVHGKSDSSISEEAKTIASRTAAFSHLGARRNPLNGEWPIPDELPVEQLAPLDMGATLGFYGDLDPPKGGRRFLKELGSIPIPYRQNNNFYKSYTLHELIKPLAPLIKDNRKWILTSNDPETMNRTIHEKIDHAPKENHNYHQYLWATYRALAKHLLSKGCRILRSTDTELELSVNKQSTMGYQDKDLDCSNVGEYLLRSDVWKSEVAKFKKHLLTGRPIKADYNSSGKREPKCENRTRMVWSLCATGRLYEAQVLGSADKLLNKLPYTIKGMLPQDFGEIFDKMLNQNQVRHAICDDIKGWDTKISYSMLCMEAFFLQLLAEDDEHRNEIKHLYRLYAYPLVSVVEADSDSRTGYRKVFYQLQGQVASGRRVTYCMNTITNIAVTMTRAAVSQGIKLKKMDEWIGQCLSGCGHSYRYGGKISGDDTVIILAKLEAKLFATKGAYFMNDIGLIRKKTGADRSLIDRDLSSIEFCSRKFVDVPMYLAEKKAATRLIPIRKVEEIIMRKMLREERPTYEYDLAWVREQGKNLLIEYFHIPTIKRLALAILSATPNNIALDGDNEESWCYTSVPQIQEFSVIKEINEHYFGKNTTIKSNYRAQSLKDLGYISKSDRKLYDLDFKSATYQDWNSKLTANTEKLREPNKPYDDWMYLIEPEASRTKLYLLLLILCALVIYIYARGS